MRRGFWVVIIVLAGCLPEDTRPPPGEVRVQLVPDAVLHARFATADGWDIAYDRLSVVVGNVQPRGCVNYSESTSYYTRILDLLHPDAQTVATAFALGACDVGFQLATAEPESVLGAGVREADARALRSAVLTVAGVAVRSGVQFEFDWTFRQAFDYERCALVQLRSGESLTLNWTVRGAELFRDLRDRELRFDIFAAADGDGDLAITLDELAMVPALERELRLERLPQLVRPPQPDSCEIHVLP